MSAIDDARTLVQDIVAPDLKAVSARLDAVERAVKLGFETSEKSVSLRFDAVEKLAEVRHELILLRMQTGFAAMDAKLDTLQKSLDMDRRLEVLEAAQGKVQ